MHEIEEISVWYDEQSGDFTEGTVSGADSVTVADGLTITASDLDYGYRMNVRVRYTDWPTALSADNSADNAPDDGWYNYDDGYYGRDSPVGNTNGFVVYVAAHITYEFLHSYDPLFFSGFVVCLI